MSPGARFLDEPEKPLTSRRAERCAGVIESELGLGVI
jgi:hypothetical protein